MYAREEALLEEARRRGPGRAHREDRARHARPRLHNHLTLGGKKVTTLKQGVRYRLLISDRSASHDFHLAGPGLNRVLTSVDFIGTKSVVLH